jgi:ADP-heptose:LPS heptosyltransferase
MSNQGKILVIRFSAMGDVAMTAPVIKEFLEHHPKEQLLIVSRSTFEPFFKDIPNLQFLSFEPKGRHSGFFGLLRLFFELRRHNVAKVADLHNNLRSKILCLLFFLTGTKTVSLDKGRSEKKLLTKQQNKVLIPLKLTVDRYAEVFQKLGFTFKLTNKLVFNYLEKPDNEEWIGVSPFAQHIQKVYPLNKMENIVLELAGKGFKLFIFGGTVEEAAIAENWESKHPNIKSLVSKMILTEELNFIERLDVMLSMDSSGMHLASLKNVPVVSIWGATHPYAGFLGYGQSINDAVQIDLYCRPCSVYGNVPCYRGDFACMNNLPEQDVIDKVIDKLRNHETAIIS